MAWTIEPRTRTQRWPTAEGLNGDQVALAQRLYDAGAHTVQQIADIFSVPRTTVDGHLDNATKATPRLATVADGAGRRAAELNRRRPISAVGGW